jgi:SAM-dependent methyltransferase
VRLSGGAGGAGFWRKRGRNLERSGLHDRSRSVLVYSIDVSRDAIEEGKRKHPEAHWLFYNRYNFAFNPGGVDRLELPPTERDFDYILAYSVFTHMSKAEMLETVAELETRLARGGTLAFTFVDHCSIL